MKSLLSLLLIVLLNTNNAFAIILKGQETNGGDPYAAEFFNIWDRFTPLLPAYFSLPNGQGLDRNELQRVRSIVRISSEEKITLDGVEKGAVNRPHPTSPQIIISRSYWGRILLAQKQLIVLHEVLPLVGINDKDYANSNAIFQSLTEDKSPDERRGYISAIRTCEPDVISQLTQYRFEKIFKPNDRMDMLFLAVQSRCAEFLRRLTSWGYDFNVCYYSGSNTPLTKLFQNADSSISFVETLNALLEGGAKTQFQCPTEVADACISNSNSALPELMKAKVSSQLTCPLQ
ncbi:hypothetical protein [Bdellovibrio svalbardensis]|uniref:Uncharacterized protein n=1 Tax=Bdellovibrio svalbardensis TaxID=2972972 RepID=A0ABT6DIM2_9BACT|nr:hypothetical protein [Bdellovibrio svalbardensis]MDG0815779.1 hypothetical protein [Bdellovibrio svalbardensis]